MTEAARSSTVASSASISLDDPVPTVAQVEVALDSVAADDGVIVVGPVSELLADPPPTTACASASLWGAEALRSISLR